MINKVLVSSCLLGDAVRYDASSNLIQHDFLELLIREDKIIKVCPEVMGGLSIPRPAAEIQSNKVFNILQVEVTPEFSIGAEIALSMATKHNIKLAILKANSPSCSNQHIYDGSFNGKLIEGMGITAALLSRCGIKVFNEFQLDEAQKFYQLI